MNVWRPPSTHKEPPQQSHAHDSDQEVALIIEDDVTVSPYFWRWLRLAHAAYDSRSDVSGYSVSHPDMEHRNGGLMEVSINRTVFLYKIICTWGFSPHAVSWREFQVGD